MNQHLLEKLHAMATEHRASERHAIELTSEARGELFSLVDHGCRKIGEPLALGPARRKAQLLAGARRERVSVVPAGRDIYSATDGEHFYPADESDLLEHVRWYEHDDEASHGC